MKKQLSVLIAFCLFLSLVYNIHVQAVTSDELYYQPKDGAWWKYKIFYNSSKGNEVKTDYAGTQSISGKTYHLLKESQPFVCVIFSSKNPDLVGIDPYLTFRKNESGQMVGYGAEANYLIESDILGLFYDEGIFDVNMSWPSNEWIHLLASPAVGQNWNVFTGNLNFSGRYSGNTGKVYIKANLLRKETVKTDVGSFDAYVVGFDDGVIELNGKNIGYFSFIAGPRYYVSGCGIAQLNDENVVLGKLTGGNSPGCTSCSAPLVKLDKPTGGEIWSKIQEIKWNATPTAGGTITGINLDYTTDGTTWQIMSSNEPNDGSFTWDTTKVPDSNTYKIKVTAMADCGATGVATSESFTIDNTPPNLAQNLSSSSHKIGECSKDDTVDVKWGAAIDAVIGLDGYSIIWDSIPDTLPDITKDIEETATEASSQALSEGDGYFHIRSVDKAGNWSDIAAHIGPFKIDKTPPGPVASLQSPSHEINKCSDNPSVVAKWESPVETCGLKGYSVVWDINSGTIPDDSVELGPDIKEHTSPKFATGKDYWFHVKSLDVAGNASGANQTAHLGPFLIDTDPLPVVTGLSSSTHNIDGCSSESLALVKWDAVKDTTICGLQGYSFLWDTNPDTLPDNVVELPPDATEYSEELADGKHYFHISVVGISGKVSSPAHFGPIGIDTEPPGLVSNLHSTTHEIDKCSNENVVEIEWEPAVDTGCGLKGYSIDWDEKPDTLPDETMDIGLITKYTSPDMPDGVKYWFHIRSLDVAGKSSEKAVHIGTFFADTIPPTSVTELISPSHSVNECSDNPIVIIKWQPAADEGCGLKGYSVYWDADSPVEIGDATEYTGPKLADGSHDFHIRSMDKVGNLSDVASLGPFFIDTTGPGAVSSLKSTSHNVNKWSNDDTVDIQWSAPADNGCAGLGGYSIVWDNSPLTIPDCVKDMDEKVTQAESPNLTGGTEFYFHIRPMDKLDNCGGLRDIAHLGPFLIDTVKPPEVTDLDSDTHKIGEYSTINVVKVNWTPAQDKESGLDGYSALWDTNPATLPEEKKNLEANITESASPKLADGEHWFHIRSMDKSGNWCDTAVHIGPFKIDTIPPTLAQNLSSPSHTVKTCSSDQVIKATWDPATDAGSGLKGYSVLWDTRPDTIPDDTVVLGPDIKEYSSGNLADGNSHYFHIKGIDNVGNALKDAAHIGPFMIDTTGPGTVANLKSMSHQLNVWNKDNTVDMQWASAEDQGCAGLSGYSVVWDGNPDTMPGPIKNTESITTITSPALTGGTDFYCHIRAVDKLDNWSDLAEHLGPFKIDAVKSTEVSNLRSDTHTPGECSSRNVIRARWDPAQDNESGLDGYSVAWDTNPGTLPPEEKKLEADITESESPELAVGCDHYFHIRSVDKVGNWDETAAHIGPFCVDTEPPTLSISSLSHIVNTWSNKNVVIIRVDAIDKGCGLDGYSVLWDKSPDTEPAKTANTALAETVESPKLTDGIWYFHIKAVDKANLWSDTQHLGPFNIDTDNVQPPANLASDSHVSSGYSKKDVIDTRWKAGFDDLSGLDGYLTMWDNNPATEPDFTKGKHLDANATGESSPKLPDAKDHWFHIRSIDKAGNMSKTLHLGPFYIDTTGPGAVTGLISISHQLDKCSNDNVLKFEWKPAIDALSGLDGYSVVVDKSSATIPGAAKNLEADATAWASNPLSDASYYLHIRSVDKIGNWSSQTEHIGPFTIDATPPTMPVNLSSNTHEVGVYSNQNKVNISWIGSTDYGCGLDGYCVSWDRLSNGRPDCKSKLDSGRNNIVSDSLSDGNNHYFHIMALDKAGNTSDVATLGPFYIDVTSPVSVQVFSLSEGAGSDYIYIKDKTLYYSGLETVMFTVCVSGNDTGSGLNKAEFPNATGTGGITTSIGSDANCRFSYQYEVVQGATFQGKVNIKVYDKAGNYTLASFDIIQDNKGPNKPTNLKLSDTVWNTTGEVTLTWNGEGDTNGGSGILDYYVGVNSDKQGTPSLGKKSMTLPLEDSKEVKFYVWGVDNAGNRGESANVAIGVDTKAPSEVVGVTHSDDAVTGYDNDSDLEFEWEAAKDNIQLDHYQILVSVDGGAYKLQDDTKNTNYKLSGKDGQSYQIKVVAVDGAGNEGPESDPSEEIMCDASPPAFIIAALPNPGFSSYMDIAVVASEKLQNEPPELKVNMGGEKPVALNNISDSIWVGNYNLKLGDTGIAALAVSGKDFAGNETIDNSKSFSVETVLAKAPSASIQDSQGNLKLYMPPKSFQQDTLVVVSLMNTITGLEKVNQLALSLSDTSNELESVGSKYLVWSSSPLMGKAVVTMKYEKMTKGICLYGWNRETQKWEYVDGVIDENQGIITAKVEKLGTFGLYADTKSPQVTHISPADGTKIKTSLPEFTVRLTDNGSGVDTGSISLMIDGKASITEQIQEDDLYILKLKQGLTEGKHTFTITGKDRAGNPFATAERIIHVPYWAVIPEASQLLQNYPNPFNPETWIPYRLAETSRVELQIYTVSGQLIRTIELGQQDPGVYIDQERAIYWDGKNETGEKVSSGIYFYQLIAGKYVSTKKMLINR